MWMNELNIFQYIIFLPKLASDSFLFNNKTAERMILLFDKVFYSHEGTFYFISAARSPIQVVICYNLFYTKDC